MDTSVFNMLVDRCIRLIDVHTATSNMVATRQNLSNIHMSRHMRLRDEHVVDRTSRKVMESLTVPGALYFFSDDEWVVYVREIARISQHTHTVLDMRRKNWAKLDLRQFKPNSGAIVTAYLGSLRHFLGLYRMDEVRTDLETSISSLSHAWRHDHYYHVLRVECLALLLTALDFQKISVSGAAPVMKITHPLSSLRGDTSRSTVVCDDLYAYYRRTHHIPHYINIMFYRLFLYKVMGNSKTTNYDMETLLMGVVLYLENLGALKDVQSGAGHPGRFISGK